MDATPSFGQWLKARRRWLGLTQDALGEQVGCAGETIRKIEAGGVRPSTQLAQLLAARLELSVEEQVVLVKWARGGPAPAALQVVSASGSVGGTIPSTVRPRAAETHAIDAIAPTVVHVHVELDDRENGQVKELAAQDHNPYKGLRAFQEADAADFFGRQALTRRLVARLGESSRATEFARFLAVVGPSGSGKSSVVRAGLLPAIRAGALPGSERWPIVQMIPGAQPLEELEAALLRISVNPPESLMRQLNEDQRGLLRAIKRVLPEDPSVELFLLIDQFEEVFTLLSDEAARVHLLDSLYVAVADPSSRLRVVITLRADFYDRPLQYGQLGELLRARSELVLPMSAEDLEQVIVRPAEGVGVDLEPELLGSLLGDTAGEPGRLPLLQYALTELFEKKEGSRLKLAAYRAGGGLHGVLGQRAEEIYAEFAAPEQQLTRQLFLRLVTLGEGVEDTRRRVRLDEVASLGRDDRSVTHVIEQFARYRLLTLDRDLASGGATVEVAHEALLQAWGRLREWLDDAREDVRTERRLLAAANEWVASGEDPSFLVSGSRLGQFQTLSIGALSPSGVALNQLEQRFVEESLREEERREGAEREREARELKLAQQTAESARRAAGAQKSAASRLRILVAGLAIFLLVTAALAAWALNQSGLANANEQIARANLADADALRLGAEANNLLLEHGDNDLIALLSIRSMNLAYTVEADAALETATTLQYNPVQFSGHSQAVLGVAFSPDDKYLATASSDETAILWDVATARLLRVFSGHHTAAVNSLAFSPDGKYLVTGSDDATALLWDIGTGQPVRTFSGSKSGIGRLAFSSDGRYLLTCDGMTARLWDVASGAQLRTFDGHTDRITSVAYAPDGKYVLTGSLDNSARIWDAATGRQVRILAGRMGAILDVAFSPDGRYIATGSQDATVRLWDAASGTQLRSYVTATGGPNVLSFSHSGKYLLIGEDEAVDFRLLDIASGQTLHTYDTAYGLLANWLAFSPDDKWIAGARQGTDATLWSAETLSAEPRLLGDTGPVWQATFSPDGKSVLTGSADKTVRLWDPASGQELRTYLGHTDEIRGAVFSPDGKWMLTASRDKLARLWDVVSGSQVVTYTGHDDLVSAATFSPDGKYVVTSSSDGTARLWDAQTGRTITIFRAHSPGTVTSVAFSHNGKVVASGGQDKTARVWDPLTGTQLMALQGHSDIVNGIAFSPDDKYLLTSSFDGSARLWDIASGKEVRRFIGHKGPVYAVAFSPDGKYVLTGGDDMTARLWDEQSGKELRRFTGHTASIRSVAFSPDGKYVLTGSHDNTARLWYTDYHDTIRYVCGLVSRDLTPGERTQYGITDQGPTCPSE
jgi:WD40 repeat protein/DNA-binding XRE family transcriptional regulator